MDTSKSLLGRPVYPARSQGKPHQWFLCKFRVSLAKVGLPHMVGVRGPSLETPKRANLVVMWEDSRRSEGTCQTNYPSEGCTKYIIPSVVSHCRRSKPFCLYPHWASLRVIDHASLKSHRHCRSAHLKTQTYRTTMSSLPLVDFLSV